MSDFESESESQSEQEYPVYSRDECIDAVRGFYKFLTDMYLDESYVQELPEGGWPSITPDKVKTMGKSEAVCDLLRHLPYLKKSSLGISIAPDTPCADWHSLFDHPKFWDESPESYWMCSDPIGCTAYIPADVVGLSSGGRDAMKFMLDTRYGIVYWYEPPDYIQTNNPLEEVAMDDPLDYLPKEEALCMVHSMVWTVADFFEVLKTQYRSLGYVPLDWETIERGWGPDPEHDGRVPRATRLYREHGWPDLDVYRKQECVQAIESMLEEK